MEAGPTFVLALRLSHRYRHRRAQLTETRIAESKSLISLFCSGVLCAGAGMLGKSVASPLLSASPCLSAPDISTTTPNNALLSVNLSNGLSPNAIRGPWSSHVYLKKWAIYSTAQVESITLNDEERKKWEACRQALSSFKFSSEEEDKILGKAFGHIHSPYWSEERKRETPEIETVSEILGYLRNLSLSDDDMRKLLKKFPEVLGCDIEHELRNNVQILGKDWGIEGKSLRNLLLRNPKVLGYNVDCKGDCMAQCTRCWVRF